MTWRTRITLLWLALWCAAAGGCAAVHAELPTRTDALAISVGIVAEAADPAPAEVQAQLRLAAEFWPEAGQRLDPAEGAPTASIGWRSKEPLRAHATEQARLVREWVRRMDAGETSPAEDRQALLAQHAALAEFLANLR